MLENKNHQRCKNNTGGMKTRQKFIIKEKNYPKIEFVKGTGIKECDNNVTLNLVFV